MIETVVTGKMLGVGRHMRVLFDQKITDPAELKRAARVYLGLPSRMPVRDPDPEGMEDLCNRLRAALDIARNPS